MKFNSSSVLTSVCSKYFKVTLERKEGKKKKKKSLHEFNLTIFKHKLIKYYLGKINWSAD